MPHSYVSEFEKYNYHHYYEQTKVTQPNKPVVDVTYMMFFCVVLLSRCFYCHLKMHKIVGEQFKVYLRPFCILKV